MLVQCSYPLPDPVLLSSFGYFLFDQKVTKNQGKNNPSTHVAIAWPRAIFASPPRLGKNYLILYLFLISSFFVFLSPPQLWAKDGLRAAKRLMGLHLILGSFASRQKNNYINQSTKPHQRIAALKKTYIPAFVIFPQQFTSHLSKLKLLRKFIRYFN